MPAADLLRVKSIFWPHVNFYRQQEDIVISVRDNDETIVPAGNMLGKDFVAAFVVLSFFLSRYPCKGITTSVKESHLDVLWGEIEKFLRISKYPLILGEEKEVDGKMYVGSSLTINNDGMRRVWNGQVRKDSYVKKLVASERTLESFQGHHVTPDPEIDGLRGEYDNLPRNLFVCDEASAMPDAYYRMAKTWARRVLLFGNCWPCQNYFRAAVEGDPSNNDPGGDILRSRGGGWYRKVIKIRAEDSPNVIAGKILDRKRGLAV